MSTIDAAMLLARLNQLPTEGLKNDPKTRKDALALSRALVASLEDPVNRATELSFTVSPT